MNYGIVTLYSRIARSTVGVFSPKIFTPVSKIPMDELIPRDTMPWSNYSMGWPVQHFPYFYVIYMVATVIAVVSLFITILFAAKYISSRFKIKTPEKKPDVEQFMDIGIDGRVSRYSVDKGGKKYYTQ